MRENDAASDDKKTKQARCTILEDGTIVGHGIPNLRGRKKLTFKAETDCVLCFSDASLFGKSRYELKKGEEIELDLPDRAVSFDWKTKVGRTTWECSQPNYGSGGEYP